MLHFQLGNCGVYNRPTEHIVALATSMYNHGQHCGSHIQAWYQGRSIIATVVDSCTGCAEQDIDLSPSAFLTLAPLGVGRLHGIEWDFVQQNSRSVT